MLQPKYVWAGYWLCAEIPAKNVSGIVDLGEKRRM